MRTATPQGREGTTRGLATGEKHPAAAFLGWWAFWLAASLLLYLPGLRAGYFSDDLLFFFNSTPRHLWDYFATRGAAVQAYRPLEAVILTLIQQKFRFETLPIHLLSLSAHAGLCCLVWAAARRLGFRPAERWLAGVFMLVTQAGAPAVLGNDTLSQSASAFLGALSAFFLSLIWFQKSARHSTPGFYKCLIASVMSYMGSLFFKETGLGFVLVAAILVCAIAFPEGTWKARIRRTILLCIPYGVATLVYLAARLHAGGAVSQSGNYRIQVGFNVVRNILEFSLAAFGPMSTVDGAVAVAMHRLPELIADMLGCLFVVATLLAGIVASGRRTLALWLTVLALASLFPAYLLTHVSELYLYNAIPFLALAMGMALGSLWYRTHWRRWMSVACAALLICGELYADREKAQLMALNGRRAGIIYAEIAHILPALPSHSRILLVNPPNRSPEYSVFLLKGFDVVDLGNLRIGPVLGRPDVRVELIEESQAKTMGRPAGSFFFSLDPGGGIRPYDTPAPR